MSDQVIGVTIKGIGDFSDVVSNVGSVQKALTKLKLPDKLGDSLNKNISNFYKEYEKYQKKITEGIHTQGDQNAVNKSLNSMLNSYEKIVNEFGKLSKKDFKEIFNLDDSAFASVQKRIKDIQTELKKVKIDSKQLTEPMKAIANMTKANAVVGEGKGLNKLQMGIDVHDFTIMKEAIVEIETYYNRFSSKMSEEKRIAMADEIQKLKAPIIDAADAADKFEKELEEANQELTGLGTKATGELSGVANSLDKTKIEAESVVTELKRIHEEEFSFNREAQNIDRQIQSYFGLSQMIRKVGDIAKDAFQTVKDLDEAMTQTAVVTNFSVGDMWDMLPTYTQQANQLGSTIRDVYEAATLYYQQGLNTNQAMSLANETLKMARIAGLDAADATNMMTAALRGFNMEINQTSAQKINDVYSELAAITASDTREIGSAMERTASIANAANMEFETTSAFLAQMIETTREAPENLGTAMKTIVARFQEMKQDPTKLVDSEGVAMDANKVDKALKTIGVELMNTKGEFRDLDDVFLDIASKWDSLSQGQQRYIATIAAGSRQQSRFIAMMSDYERTMELVDAANNSAGASQRQFEKTLDSMEAKLNKLKNAWDQFTMGLMNNQILKFGVDALTEGFTIVNKFIDVLGKLPPKPFEGITKSALTLITTLGMLQFGKKASRGLVMGGVGWWKGETSLLGGFQEGWRSSGQTGLFANRKGNNAAAQGKVDALAYNAAVQQEMAKGGITKALAMAWKTKGKSFDFTNTFQAAFGQFSGERFAASWSTDIESEIIRVLNSVIDDSARIGEVAGKEFKQNLIAQLKTGKISGEQLISSVSQVSGKDISGLGVNAKELNNGAKAAENFGTKIGLAGDGLLRFGSILQGTPLAPFGTLLSTIGMTLSTFGSTINWVADTFMIGMGKVVAAEGTGVAATKLLAGGFKELFVSMGPVGWAILGITALVSAYMLLKDKIPTAANALNQVTDAAAAASEAYDSAKQEASELADSINTIRETDDAFDGLVVGTAAFNEQLITANEQIMELVKKYPMLNDYLTTDKNGVMHISEEGLQAVKDYQRQRLANASALNILQNADLNAEENRQKAEQLRKIRGAMTQEEHAQNLEEADLLEKRIKAENESAKLAAVNTALVDKEIGDREKVSAILADQYDMRKSMVQLEGDKHDLRQQYADFYGYNYNRSTKKMTDIEGNEIEFDDKVIQDALKDITVLADLEVDAGSVDTAISSIDRKFSKYFKDSNFFSDILSSNIETNEDELRNLLQNPGQLQDIVSELSSNELAVILGVSADAVELDSKKYENDLIDKLTKKAENIAESQSEAWGEFGAMLAQAEGAKADALLSGQGIGLDNIKSQLEHYTAKQRDLMLSVGKSLESGAGAESMKTFIRGASDIYRSNVKEIITELNSLIENVNWDSPIARLQAYKNLATSTTPQIKQMGEALLNSTESANLLGEAFEEFYNSSDWAEVAENMDNFVDSTGKLNAVGVEEMAKQCHSLNNLLDTGAISAGGVAAAINALGTDGELTLLDLNSTVLQLLSSFGQLDDIIGRAHNSIENFDWGLDTGESADFVKESAEKWNELYKGGEIGNPQLEAYAKYVLGEEKYIDLLADNSGNLQATMDEVSKYVNEYADGFDKAWGKLADGQWKGKVPKELQDLGISFGYDENGNWEWNPGTATTEQLSEWLQAVKGIGPEMAAAMIEDWQNYSPDFRAERQKNDFYAGLDNYISSRAGDQGVTVTTSELETIAAATGQEVDEVRAAITETAEQNGQKLTEINNTVEGGLTTDQLNAQYTQAKTGSAKGSWIDQLITTVDGQKQVDASQAITQAISDGFTQTQAENMAYDELSKAVAEGTDVWYKDKLLTPEDLASFDNFKNAIAEFEENSQWVEVGKAIAEGVVSYIKGETTPKTEKETKDTSVTPTVIKPSQQDNRYTDTGTGNRETYTNSYSKAEEQQYSRGLIAALKEIFPKPAEKDTPTELTPAQQQKMYGEPGVTTTEEANSSLLESGAAMGLAATSLTESSTTLSQSATELSSSAKELSSAADKLNTPDKQPGGTFTSGKVQTGQSNENVQSNVNIDTTDATNKILELQIKLKELNDLISGGGTYNLTVSGVDDIKAAASAAKTLTKNSGTKTIGVKTGKADTSSVKTAQSTIGNTQAKIQVGANVDPAIAAARRVQRTINSMSAKLNVSINQTGNRTVNIIVKESGKTVGTTSKTISGNAKGKNNHGIIAAPVFGSVARGRYGQLGPKGKGGLTLTGELGYEVAWLPDENRSMILGANGPQMINLPKNAVIWDHKQSKEILKQKAIPAGSHSTSTRPGSTSSSGGSSTSRTVARTANHVRKKADEAAAAVKKVSVWWENIARKTELSQRIQDNNQKAFEKYLKEMRATLRTTGESLEFGGGGGDDYLKSIGKTLGYYEAQLEKVTSELSELNRGTDAQIKAREKVQAAKDTQTKKDDKKAKQELKKANKKAYENNASSAAKISYKKGKKSKEEIVNLAPYIKEEDGTLVVDQSVINTIKNKNKRKAVADAANKEINDRLSKKYKAEDEIQKAQEAIEKFGEELYETFFKWENELTKIWNITQKIEQTELRISQAKGYSELLESQLSTGMAKAGIDFANQTLGAFKTRIQQQATQINQSFEALNQKKIDLSKLISLDDEKETLANIQQKLVASIYEQDNIAKLEEQLAEASAVEDYEAAKAAYEEAKKELTLNDTQYAGYEEYAKAIEDNIATQAKAWKFMTAQQLADGTINVDFDSDAFEAEKLAGNITEEQGKAIEDYVKSITDSSKELSQQYTDTTSLINDMYGELNNLQDAWAGYADQLWQISDEQQKKEVDNLKKLSDSLNNTLKNLLDDVKRKLDDRRKQEDNTKAERGISQKQQRLAALRADTAGGHQVEIAQLQQEIANDQQTYQRSLEDQLLDKLQQQADLAAQQREHQIALQEATISEINNAAQVNAWMDEPEKYRNEIYEAFKEANDYNKKPEALQQQLDNEFNTLFNGLLTNQEEQQLVTNQIRILEGKTDEIKSSLDDIVNLGGALNNLVEVISQLDIKGLAPEITKPTGITESQTTAAVTSAAQAAVQQAASAASTPTDNTAIDAYKAAIEAAHNKKTVSKNTFIDAVNKGKAAGLDVAQVARDLAEGDGKGGVTWEETVKAAKKAGYSKATVAKWSTDSYLAKAIKKWSKFAKGGIVDYTGPAWLDGTPSKPELVLNSTDTKNFLVLRDVLSRAMSSIDTTSNSYDGDTMYEININVDHLNNDYDVDKVIEKVKKEITKGARYRNVTQVRNFR